MIKFKDLQQFYKGKKILITGHTGFKGSWACLLFKELQADVFGYALAPSGKNPHIFELLKVKDHVNSCTADIRDYDSVLSFVKAVGPDIVIHMAAQPLVIDSYNDPLNTYTTNAIGTANILEAIKNTAMTKAFLNITTDKVYKNDGKKRAFREGDQLGGDDPYSSSKACSELITESYKKSFFRDVAGYLTKGIATARAGNVIGGGDFATNRIIPDIFRSLQNKEELVLRYPHSTRPWQHVLEPLYVYAVLCCKLYESPQQYSTSWNIGPDIQDTITVENLLECVSKVLGYPVPYRILDGPKRKEAHTLALDCSMLREHLGWKPLQNLQTTINMVCEWYTAFGRKDDLYALTQRQIQSFLGS